jgi:hypothetical protein
MTTCIKDNTCRKRPFPNFLTYSTTQEVIEPTYFTQATQRLKMRHAMILELNALVHN